MFFSAMQLRIARSLQPAHGRSRQAGRYCVVDRLIDAVTEWDRDIQRALAEAVAVVVLWSWASVNSHYVRAEARHAAQRRALVPVMINACEPPMPFGEFQSIDSTSWRDAGHMDAVIAAIVGAIERIQSGRPPETSHHRWSARTSQGAARAVTRNRRPAPC